MADRTAALTRPIVSIVRAFNAAVRATAAGTHWLQYKTEGALQGDAEWFDHEVDAYWQWPRRHQSYFLERGVLSAITLRPTDRVLELCSGDGFFTERFYAPRVAEVVAIDANDAAVRHARRRHRAPNIRYVVGDITAGLPPGPFDHVVWDSAMHHFDDDQIEAILGDVSTQLTPSGLVTGYTEIEDSSDYSYSVTRFTSPGDVADRLARHFAHAAVLETRAPGRRNLYFFASNDRTAIPVAAEHPMVEARPRVSGTPSSG